MSRVRRELGESGIPVRWLARVSSIAVSGVFLLVLFLAVTNEDKPQMAAIPVLALLGLTIAATLAAWRWEQVGGLVVALLAFCLGAASYSASLAFGLGSLSLLPALMYGVPFLAVGGLFWICGRREGSGSRHDLAPRAPALRQWWFIAAVLTAIVALTVVIAALMTGARVGG